MNEAANPAATMAGRKPGDSPNGPPPLASFPGLWYILANMQHTHHNGLLLNALLLLTEGKRSVVSCV